MKVRMTIAIMVLVVGLAAGSAYAAQAAPPPATPPAQTQQPPAQPPAAKPEPPAPVPFPEGAKVAYVFMQGIFNGSAEGKAAAAKVQEFEKKKVAEIQAKVKEAEALQSKLQSAGLLNDTARSQGERDLQRLQRELQAMREDAEAEGQALRQQLLDDFSRKVNPVIAELAKEKNLHMVFSVSDGANVAWAYPGLDLTAEIIKRVDAAAKAAPKK